MMTDALEKYWRESAGESIRTGKSVRQQVAELKSNGQDHEWYPTTDEIVDAVAADIRRRFNEYDERLNVTSVLDIGACVAGSELASRQPRN